MISYGLFACLWYVACHWPRTCVLFRAFLTQSSNLAKELFSQKRWPSLPTRLAFSPCRLHIDHKSSGGDQLPEASRSMYYSYRWVLRRGKDIEITARKGELAWNACCLFSKNMQWRGALSFDCTAPTPFLSLEMTTTRPKTTSPVPASSEGKNGTPSGFVLKLYQMVNGAPDDIVSVSGPICSLICLLWGECGFAHCENYNCKAKILWDSRGMRAYFNAEESILLLWRLVRIACAHNMMCYVIVRWYPSVFWKSDNHCHCEDCNLTDRLNRKK